MGVKLAPPSLLDLSDQLLDLYSGTHGIGGRSLHEELRRRKDAPSQRDLLSLHALRKSPAVEPLVMGCHGRGGPGMEGERLDHARPDGWMLGVCFVPSFQLRH